MDNDDVQVSRGWTFRSLVEVNRVLLGNGNAAEVRYHAQHRSGGTVLQKPESRLEQFQVATELVDNEALDVVTLVLIQ